MKAFVVVKGTQSVDGLRRLELERPMPGPGSVLVRIRAAGLNFRDLAIVNGKYIGGPVVRDTIPLCDGAGDVVELGDGVTELAVGDRVAATFYQGNPPETLGSPLDGMLTEYGVFAADGLVRRP